MLVENFRDHLGPSSQVTIGYWVPGWFHSKLSNICDKANYQEKVWSNLMKLEKDDFERQEMKHAIP
jgi:hypothetical protein